MKKTVVGISAVLLLVGLVGNAQANLLSNGDFDEKEHIEGFYGKYLDQLSNGEWDVYDSLPGGWQKGANTSGIEIQYGSVTQPDSRPYYVELDSDGGTLNNSSMFQEVFLGVGTYELSFMYRPRTNVVNDNGINAFFGNTTIGNISKEFGINSFGWEEVSWIFSITQAGYHNVGFFAYGQDNRKGGFIDSVELNPIPEPATMLLFGVGLAGLAGSRLRRKK